MTTVMWGFLIALGIVAFIVFIVLRIKKISMPALVVKSITSFVFVATAGYAVVCKQAVAPYAMLVMLGLVSGMLGDIWLDLKWIYASGERQFTYWGFASFMAGHIFYLTAILIANGSMVDRLWYLLAFAAALIIAALQMVITKKQNDYTGYRTITYIYTVFLLMTMFSSFVCMISNDFSKNTILFFAGSVFFTISDAILCSTYFDREKSKNTKPYIFANHLTYYLGQFLIAVSVFYA